MGTIRDRHFGGSAAGNGPRYCVFTIGFGTEKGHLFRIVPTIFGEKPRWFSIWRYQQAGVDLQGIDEETLQAIAKITGGEYYWLKARASFKSFPCCLPT
jgi:hypothetical protein